MYNSRFKKFFWQPMWRNHNPLELSLVEIDLMNHIRTLLAVKDDVVETMLDVNKNKIVRIKGFLGIESEIERYDYNFFKVLDLKKEELYKEDCSYKEADDVIVINYDTRVIINESKVVTKMRRLLKEKSKNMIKKVRVRKKKEILIESAR